MWHAYLITEAAVLGAAFIAALAVSLRIHAWKRPPQGACREPRRR